MEDPRQNLFRLKKELDDTAIKNMRNLFKQKTRNLSN